MSYPSLLRDRLIHPFGRAILSSANRALSYASPIEARPVYDPKEFAKEFAWTRILENQYPSILRELEGLLEGCDYIPEFSALSRDQAHLAKSGDWRTYFFVAYGEWAHENAARCPKTVEAINKIPGLRTAFFSILAPGARIRAHRGPYGGVLRYHLGLIVPRAYERCRIRIGDEWISWRAGESVIFDDTFEHEVINDTDEARVVLFVDFERPLIQPAKEINRALLELIRRSPLVQDGVANYERAIADRRAASTES